MGITKALTIADALSAINRNDYGQNVKRLHDAAKKASHNESLYHQHIERDLKEPLSRIKSYVRRRLKVVGAHPRFEGRGWSIDFRTGETQFALQCVVHLDLKGTQLRFNLRGVGVVALDERLNAIIAAVRVVRENVTETKLGVIG